ncbi:MAG TPA: DUF3352 domain-containing protein [Solirubrobacterales bacterium]|nr:DUF3352 domain-containing protein [Solirubrobacterales bacterium]
MSVRRGGSDRSHPINEPGGPGGEDASSESGSKSQDGEESQRGGLRRRLIERLRRRKPDSPESPPASQSQAPEDPKAQPRKPLFSLEPPEEEKKPTRSSELAFRARTGLTAIGYWLREKGQIVWRQLKRAGAASAYWWSRRSRGSKLRVGAVAGIVVLYLSIKFLPVPGVPCQVSTAKECAPSNDTIAYVPRNAILYAHMTVNADSHQWELAQDLGDELPNFTALLQSDTSALDGPAGRPLDLSAEVLPWVKDDLTLLGVPGPKGTTPETYVAGVGDATKADQFAASLSPGGPAKQVKAGDATISVYSNDVATARSGDQLLFGNVAAVRAALSARAGQLPGIEGSDQDEARDQLPDVRLAEVYLSRAGVQRFLPAGATGATQLDTFVDYGATSGVAVGARARDDGVQVNVVSKLDPKLVQRSPTVFASLPEFEPSLADEAGPRALGYVGVGELGPAINNALATAGTGAQGLAGSLRGLAQRLQQEAGVDPLKDLLPALGGQAALVAEPTGSTPYASLIVDGVDEEKAGDALASLQRPLMRSLSTEGAPVPSFQTREIDGVTVHSVQVSPTVDLSYAIFDGKLVLSTRPEGVSQVRSSGDNLAGTSTFEDATDPLPDRVSALVFLNLEEVLGLAQQAGLAENPLYASLSEDISRVGSLGLAVSGSDDELRSELFLTIND